jgi:hypothetical protein
MAEFLVSPPEPTRWSMSPDAFAAAVAQRWPQAGVRRWADGANLRASAWIRAATAWDDLLLELHASGDTLGIDARSQAVAAEVACWWRRQVPAEVPVLWLYDRGFSGYSMIWPETTPGELFTGSAGRGAW